MHWTPQENWIEVSAELEYYRKMFRLSQAKRFGRKSEKSLIDDGQQECFLMK